MEYHLKWGEILHYWVMGAQKSLLAHHLLKNSKSNLHRQVYKRNSHYLNFVDTLKNAQWINNAQDLCNRDLKRRMKTKSKFFLLRLSEVFVQLVEKLVLINWWKMYSEIMLYKKCLNLGHQIKENYYFSTLKVLFLISHVTNMAAGWSRKHLKSFLLHSKMM